MPSPKSAESKGHQEITELLLYSKKQSEQSLINQANNLLQKALVKRKNNKLLASIGLLKNAELILGKLIHQAENLDDCSTEFLQLYNKVLYFCGLNLFELNKFNQAQNYFSATKKVAIKVEPYVYILSTIYIEECHLALGQPASTEALENIRKNLENYPFLNQLNKTSLVSQVYFIAGKSALMENRLDEATAFLEKAEELLDDKYFSDVRLNVIIHQARVYFAHKDYDNASLFRDKAIALNDALKMDALGADFNYLCALIAMEKQDDSKALELFSANCKDKNSTEFYEALSLLFLSFYQLRNKEIEIAGENMMKAVQGLQIFLFSENVHTRATLVLELERLFQKFPAEIANTYHKNNNLSDTVYGLSLIKKSFETFNRSEEKMSEEFKSTPPPSPLKQGIFEYKEPPTPLHKKDDTFTFSPNKF